MQFFMLPSPRIIGPFIASYHCIPCSHIGRPEIDEGDKILLPSSALDQLARLSVQFPMVFEVVNQTTNAKFHCGVLEFSSEEGYCVLPNWVMDLFGFQNGEILQVKNVTLPKAELVRLKPKTSEFWLLSNPKVFFEKPLRKYSCLTLNNSIRIKYNNKSYEFEVKKLEPENKYNAVCIIETDCQLEFEASEEMPRSPAPKVVTPPPAPTRIQRADGTFVDITAPPFETKEQENQFTPFVGQGFRLDGKPSTKSPNVGSRSTTNTISPTVLQPSSSLSSTSTSPPPFSLSSTSSQAKTSETSYQPVKATKYSQNRVKYQAFMGTGNSLK